MIVLSPLLLVLINQAENVHSVAQDAVSYVTEQNLIIYGLYPFLPLPSQLYMLKCILMDVSPVLEEVCTLLKIEVSEKESGILDLQSGHQDALRGLIQHSRKVYLSA